MGRWLEHSVTTEIRAPVEQVWEVWSDLESMPQWMRWIESVVTEPNDPDLTDWTLAAQDADNTWHGRVDESLNVMPSTSHIAGGRWWEKRIEEGTLRFTPEAPRLKTARQEGCLERRPAVPDTAQMAFVAGRTELNIEELSARNQLRKCDLLWMITELGFPEEAVRRWSARSRPWLCSKIREQMAGMSGMV